MGSASELDYHLMLAKDPRMIDQPEYSELAERMAVVKRMLNALIQKLRRAA